jgi:hypothetical protein
MNLSGCCCITQHSLTWLNCGLILTAAGSHPDCRAVLIQIVALYRSKNSGSASASGTAPLPYPYSPLPSRH